MTYTAVVFDLDGTLLDTLPDIAAAGNEVLAAMNVPTYSVEDFGTLIGSGVAMLFTRALPPEKQADETIAHCVARFRETYAQHWNVRTCVYDGIEQLLDELVKRDLKMSVLSNKPDAFAKQCVAAYLGRYPFDPVFGQRDDVPRKPDPAAALEILSVLRVAPQNVLYLGDTGVDMQTARRAGMAAVGATWGYRTRQELLDNGADFLIDLPMELVDLMQRPSPTAQG